MIITTDIETTGMDSTKCGILSIGAVVYEDTEKYFYGECRAWDDAQIDNSSLEYNGFLLESIKDKSKKSEAALILEFFNWWDSFKEPKIMAGHNVYFDYNFIVEASKRAGLENQIARRLLDQHTLCFCKIIQNNQNIPEKDGNFVLNSDFLMNYVGIPVEPKPHNALNGAIWETEAISRLLEGKNKIAQFSKHPIPDYLKGIKNI